VRLLSIGAFAQATRLSPKALRLYGELGLLPPAFVDPDSGYRFYDPAQLERARLVAWLRRLGMPLARIRIVCDLDPAQAAGEVAAYWAQVEADTASRRDLAAFLIATLSGRKTAMPGAQEALAIRYAARTDIGRVRETNQDSAYAGSRLLAVADGMGVGGRTGQRHGGQPGGHRTGPRPDRDDGDRYALVRLPARPGAHRGLPCLPAARQ